MRVGLRSHALDFRDGNRGQEPDEQQEQRHEQTERADELPDVDPGRRIIGPVGGNVVAVQRRHDDDEALKPHADVHEDGDDEDIHHVGADFLEPEKLRADDVAADHAPVSPPVGRRLNPPERPQDERVRRAVVHEGESLVGIATVPGDEELHAVGVADDGTRREDDLPHQFDVPHGDDFFQVTDLPHRQHQRQHHAESGEHGARHEVRREDGGVPSRNLRHGEVERDDGMHGQHQRCAQAGEQQVSLLVIPPMAIRAGPTHRAETVENLPNLRLGAVAHRREVRDEPHVPEQQRHGEVGRDGEHVPQQRRTELRPDAVGIGQRQQPPAKPDAPDVNQRKNAGAHDREDGHGLGGAIDRGAPFLTKQEENRGDKRSCVADADPEDEVRDVPRPGDWDLQTPHAHPGGHEVNDHRKTHAHDEHAGDEGVPPPLGRLAFGDSGDLIGEPAERPLV